MEDIYNEEQNISFQIDSVNDSNQRLDKIYAGCRKIGVPTEEYIIYDDGDGNKYSSPHKCIVLDIPVKRLQQMLDKKNSASGDTDVVNPLLGTVTGDSKAAGISDTQLYGLLTTGNMPVIKELMGPRADDEVAKMQMIRSIEEDGVVRMKDLELNTKNKQSIKTMSVFLLAAGLEVRVKK